MKLGLIPYCDMNIIFEKGMRGGCPYVSNRYSKTNNKYINFYDPKQKSKNIKYLDPNYLHGYTMYKFL